MAGGMAALDIMLHLSRCQQGPEPAAAICGQLIYGRIRDEKARQRMPLRHRCSVAHSKLEQAVSLMAANTEESLSLEQLSRRANISRVRGAFHVDGGRVARAYPASAPRAARRGSIYSILM